MRTAKNLKVRGRITYGWKGSPGVAFTTTVEIDGKRAVCRVADYSSEYVVIYVRGSRFEIRGAEAGQYCEARSAEYDRVCATFTR